MTVKEYLDARPQTAYKKHIRILNAITKKYLGTWDMYATSYVVAAKVTTKIIFIFI